MNYVFFGTPRFAEIILKTLITAGMPPVAVVCNPDRPVGRKKIVTPPPVKSLVIGHRTPNIEILQPEKLDDSFKAKIRELKPQFAIVAAYAKIIPKSVIELFPKGTIGVHPSLLPKYRGSSPIQSVILAGEETAGVTLYMLDEKMDHGAILENRKLKIENRSYLELEKELAEIGGELLVETLPKFITAEIKPQPQNEAAATFTKKFTTEDGFVSDTDLGRAQSGEDSVLANEIERKIRALTPEPGVYTIKNGKRIKFLEAEVREGKLMLKKIQIEGKNPQAISYKL